MRRTALLIASMALAVLVVGGVALAANIACGPSTPDQPCLGTQEDDTLRGINDAYNYIDGLGGIDTIYGRNFADRLEGGRGNDTLRGEGGRDTLYGEEESSVTYRSNDRLLGGPSDDELNGGPGNDTVMGGPGNDRFIGFGSVTNRDRSYGGEGNDTFYGGYGERYGEAGDDSLFADEGDVILDGGPGNDNIFASACEANTTADATGGPGEDDLDSYPNFCDNDTPLGTSILRAVDGEQDKIYCYEAANETVRIDRQDRFYEYEPLRIGREYCDSVTIVE